MLESQSAPLWTRELVVGCLLAILGTGPVVALDRAEPSTLGEIWQEGRPVAIRVEGGRAQFDIPMTRTTDKALIIVSCLNDQGGPFPVRLDVRSVDHAAAPLTDDRASFEALRRHPDRPVATALPLSAQGQPPGRRVFHVLDKAGDPASSENYRNVLSWLRGFGNRVQVYVEARASERVSDEVIRDLITTFEGEVLPRSLSFGGPAADIDNDGRFTILLTDALENLGGGLDPVDGYVRGADFVAGLSAPFGNRCDLLYLNARLPAGPHLRTVLAHEYAHAVTFSRKGLGPGCPGGPCREEEGWLDEAIAHLVEDLHGFSRSNLDHRVRAFLSSPQRYGLVVPDYYAAELFRSHGHRGSTYLFLRWCAARCGPGLLGALIRSERRGRANLEAATGLPFADLFRRWSVDLYLEGLHGSESPAGSWLLAGPRACHVRPDGPEQRWSIAGTSSRFTTVSGSAQGAIRVEVDGPDEADLQVTAVMLPADLPRLELNARFLPDDGGGLRVRAVVQERDGFPVRIAGLAWEPVAPPPGRRDSSTGHGKLDQETLAATFGSDRLPARGVLASTPIDLVGMSRDEGTIVLKLIGIDEQGRRVTAWADLGPATLEDR